MAEAQAVAMRDEFPGWCREIGIGDNAAKLELRWKGVVAAVGDATSSSIEAMIAVALNTKPRPATQTIESLRGHFKTADPLFEMSGNDREFEILCGTALMQLFDDDTSEAAIAALSTTTTSCGGARKANLPMDVVGTAEVALDKIGERRRTRADLSEIGITGVSKIVIDSELTAFKASFGPEQSVPVFSALTKGINEALTKIVRTGNAAITALAELTEKQDEELQMLWWLFGGHSSKADAPFSEIKGDSQPVVLAAELAEMTSFLPGPIGAKAILSRAGVKPRKKLSLTAVVSGLDDPLRLELVETIEPSKITQPIHFAIKRQLETGDDTAWVAPWATLTGIDAGYSLSALELGNLFYRERLNILLGGD